MNYQNKEITINDLIDWINHSKIDLQPPYQRNFIWTSMDQRLLIDSILKGFPMPNFFTYRNSNGSLEMVDGQQRAKTIYKFFKGEIKSSDKKLFQNIDSNAFLNYKLNIVELSNKSDNESLEEFYSLVNKRGVHLNPAELNKALYHETAFLKLVNEVISIDEFIELDIFSENVEARMNDRSLIEELIAYLFKGITDKRSAVDELFNNDKLVIDKYDEIKELFNKIIHKIYLVNKIKPINVTRFKQRNDFYTLFNFVHLYLELDSSIFEYQYKILLFFNEKNFITPSNDECDAFREYALNCVSQSNSKVARIKRINFFNAVLCNNDIEKNEILQDIVSFLTIKYKIDYINMLSIGDYQLLDIVKFN